MWTGVPSLELVYSEKNELWLVGEIIVSSSQQRAKIVEFIFLDF